MDVTSITWRISSYSGSNGGACVEAGTTGPAIAVRQAASQLPVSQARHRALASTICVGVRHDTRIRPGLAIASARARDVACRGVASPCGRTC
jgi:hypothetical protein